MAAYYAILHWHGASMTNPGRGPGCPRSSRGRVTAHKHPSVSDILHDVGGPHQLIALISGISNPYTSSMDTMTSTLSSESRQDKTFISHESAIRVFHSRTPYTKTQVKRKGKMHKMIH